MTREELKGSHGSSTVGQILDIMNFSVKMLIVEKGGVACTNDALLLNEIFLLLPSTWEEDPVKVHLCTKVIYETLQGDFNNIVYVLAKIISVNRLGFYVALTLFWTLYLDLTSKKNSHHYYKMYDRNKFFKLLQFCESKEMDFQSTFRLLMLISIYQNYVLFNKEVTSECHQVFSDCFKRSSSTTDDVEKLRKYLKNLKTLIEVANPTNDAKNADAFMVCIDNAIAFYKYLLYFPLSIS